MNLIALACAVFDAAESLDTPHMAVGAIAAGAYGTAWQGNRDGDDEALRGFLKILELTSPFEKVSRGQYTGFRDLGLCF